MKYVRETPAGSSDCSRSSAPVPPQAKENNPSIVTAAARRVDLGASASARLPDGNLTMMDLQSFSDRNRSDTGRCAVAPNVPARTSSSFLAFPRSPQIATLQQVQSMESNGLARFRVTYVLLANDADFS